MSIATSCICGKCAYFCDGREGCSHNQNNPQEVPQVKSVEIHAEEVWDKHSEYIGEDIHSLDSVAGSSVIPSRYRFLKAAQDISKPLVDRIAELETQLYKVSIDHEAELLERQRLEKQLQQSEPYITEISMDNARLKKQNSELLSLLKSVKRVFINNDVSNVAPYTDIKNVVDRVKQALNSKEVGND